MIATQKLLAVYWKQKLLPTYNICLCKVRYIVLSNEVTILKHPDVWKNHTLDLKEKRAAHYN